MPFVTKWILDMQRYPRIAMDPIGAHNRSKKIQKRKKKNEKNYDFQQYHVFDLF